MPVQIPLPILRRNPIQGIAHILPNILIPILVKTECARRMLNKQIQQADFVRLDLREVVDDRIGDEVRAPRFRGERQGFLEPGHCCWRLVLVMVGDVVWCAGGVGVMRRWVREVGAWC